MYCTGGSGSFGEIKKLHSGATTKYRRGQINFLFVSYFKKNTAVSTKLLTTQTPSPRGQRLFGHGFRAVNDYAPTESAKLSTIRRDTNLREIETFRETILV